MPEVQINDIHGLLNKFRSKASAKSASSSRNYIKAINCLEIFLGTYAYSYHFPSKQTLADWFLYMRAQGLTRKTAIHYLDIISALYKGAGSDHGNLQSFAQFKPLAKSLLEQQGDIAFDGKIFLKILKITKSALSKYQVSSIAVDLLLYSILNSALNLSDVARIKVEDIDTEEESIQRIIKRNAATNRKYLFPLNQSEFTIKKLSSFAERLVKDLFESHGIPLIGSVDNTIRLIWAISALKCGIAGSEIATILGKGIEGIPELALCTKLEITAERRLGLEHAVNSLLADNNSCWYAMKLRARVRFEDIVERIRHFERELPQPELFYPYEEIRKRVGKKLVKDRQPVIKDIVFFRLGANDIFQLFCKIGDLAWCYTTTGKPGGDYAPIPQHSFERFQEAIGHFTPEYEIAPIGGFEPAEGETVVILNGPLANYELEVGKITDSNNVIFQLNMVGNNGFQWRTKARKHQIEPA